MAMCASGLLLSALVLIIILNDIFSNKMRYMVQHLFLGAIATTLFFTLCNYGLEQVNWVFLALIPTFIFIKWIYTPKSSVNINYNDECEICQAPEQRCGCPQKKPIVNKIQPENAANVKCPANPIVLSTECGISRHFKV